MGQFYDAESGLHYNRHRYYDPETAQYLSSDPIGLAGGLTPQAYVHNPTGWVDPLGLSGCPCEKNKKTTYDGASRRDALREAKRDARIPQSQQPHEISRVDLDDGHGNKIINSDGNIVKARQYHYKNIDGESIVIQEHSLGHTKATAGHGLEPHFNVRPASNMRTGSVPGIHGHYNF